MRLPPAKSTVAARVVQVTRKTAQLQPAAPTTSYAPFPRAVSSADRREASDREARAAWHPVGARPPPSEGDGPCGLGGGARRPRIDRHSSTTNPCCLDRGFAPRLLLGPPRGRVFR